jgi:hypothetical protein
MCVKQFGRDTGVSRTSAIGATKLLKPQPCNTMALHALKEHDLLARIFKIGFFGPQEVEMIIRSYCFL